ncbi:MAG: putative toxin-antitoxin system toxin component, PIN family, partial [Synechococcales cyanobacterium CRU_2_2]|nr:putative toxin-antitoxin system toxin component, PIN family [Synechococcales cyanobacterium CRU_2_2]
SKIGQVESVTCQEILDEFAEKLLVKFKFSEEMTQAAVQEVRQFSHLVEISGTLKAVPDDPDDDMVIECAVIGNATHVVTGDKHLLSLTNHQDIAILKQQSLLHCCHPSVLPAAQQPWCSGRLRDLGGDVKVLCRR